jgi:hypothetical protein
MFFIHKIFSGYRILVGKSLGKLRSWRDTIWIGYEDGGWTELGQNIVKWMALILSAFNLRVPLLILFVYWGRLSTYPSFSCGSYHSHISLLPISSIQNRFNNWCRMVMIMMMRVLVVVSKECTQSCSRKVSAAVSASKTQLTDTMPHKTPNLLMINDVGLLLLTRVSVNNGVSLLLFCSLLLLSPEDFFKVLKP